MLVSLPVLIPLATAIVLLGLGQWPRLRFRVALGSQVVLLGVVGILAYHAAWRGEILTLSMGGWAPRVGIVWVADGLSSIMTVLGAVVGLAVLVYLPKGMKPPRELPFSLVLHQVMVASVEGCFLTGDLFNLFVFFEVMLTTSYVQLTMGARSRQLVKTFPYVVINFIGGLLFLAGVGIIYGTSGTVNLALLSRLVAEGSLPPQFWGGMGLVLTVFALKTGLVPLYFWLPESYPESPIPYSAMLAGLLTKVGVYTLFRVVPLVFTEADEEFFKLLAGISAATMFLGVLGALGRDRIRQILAFHIISQVGYMTFGLSLFSPAGLAAGLFYVVHHIVVKSGLFLAGGMVERIGGSDRLKDVRGVAMSHPWAAVGFFVPAMALAGLPPFSGFWGKLFLAIAGFRQGYWITTTIAIVVSLLTLASMLKIWQASYWGKPEGQQRPELGNDPGMLAGVLGLASLSVIIGLCVIPVMLCCEQAAAQLLAVTPYVDAVLGPPSGEGLGELSP
ncbi:complex I subunit 5 family protein [Tautonia rosea]|uniref:complex I subunit 5 family protein n=1 Tax=Tautonia rosea TaxID=2728037 RepID=UPI0014731D52|nr:proton-conducting transporter membrane subunit [Tautonia rosea]